MSQSTLASLIRPLPALQPSDKLAWVAERFSSPEYSISLSIPVVENNIPVGVISRFALHRLFLPRFGRELYGKHRVDSVMNRHFIQVQSTLPLGDAAAQVSREMQLPLTEDFVVCQGDQYVGVGMVMSLLEATGKRLESNASELQKAYDNLKQSQQRLVQSEKMSSLGQMVAGLAHEMNTPLAYIRNNLVLLEEFSTQMLQEHCNDSDALISTLTDMAELSRDALFGVDQIDDLVKGLKSFSRDDGDKKVRLDINDCIRRALTLSRNSIPKSVKVQLVLAELPASMGLLSQLNQVFINLLVNAGQAISGDGVIAVKTWLADQAVMISVQDSGKGIATENLGRIFDPFFTTKDVGEGTGLGLSISYDIIQRHGGDIRVVSRLGVGTKFLISLPVITPPILSPPQILLPLSRGNLHE